MRAIGVMALVMLAVLGSGCGGPDVRLGPGSTLTRAHDVLVVAALDGPVPLQIDQVPAAFAGPEGRREVAAVASRAVRDLNATFVAEPVSASRAGPHLVFRFEDMTTAAPADACQGRPAAGSPMFESPVTLLAVFCRDETALASASGRAQGTGREEVEALIRAATARVFPSQSRGGYGYPGVSIFGAIGSGGDSGVGIGLGF